MRRLILVDARLYREFSSSGAFGWEEQAGSVVVSSDWILYLFLFCLISRTLYVDPFRYVLLLRL